MSKPLRWLLGVWGVGVLSCMPALGQNPTFSLDVMAVNSIPIDLPVSQVVVAPGDTLTVGIFLRDWSPNGELLRGYQARIDPAGYTSGEAGSLSPVNFASTSEIGEENRDNAYLDTHDPRYAHLGKATIAIVDSISPGYGWMSVIIDRSESPACPTSDGTWYYCGTVKLAVSDDARGVFTVGLYEDPGSSVLQDPESRIIGPLDFKALTITVAPDAVTPRIVSTDPPSGAIDARLPVGAQTPARGWDKFILHFNTDTAKLASDGFVIQDGSAQPPRIKGVESRGSVLTITLDRGIRAGAWTTVFHTASNTGARFGYLPGDVNGDGAVTIRDVLTLIGGPQENDAMLTVSGGAKPDALPLYRLDIDRNGTVNVSDVHRMIDLLEDPRAYRAALR